MTISAATLFVAETAAKFLNTGLELAAVLGLPVTTWRAGDPTKANFNFIAEALGELENVRAEFAKAAWISTAEGDWKTVNAKEVYGVDRVEATHATPTVTLRNTGGGYYDLDVGDLTVKSNVNDKTYHCTSAGVLSAGVTVTFDLVADEAGSDSSVEADEIDELVTGLNGVEIVSSTASIGLDEQSESALQTQCESTLGALSPNGPADAYEYVVRNSDLTGVTDITRAKTVDDSDTGDVIVYVASPSGPVAGASITAAQAAVEQWATPFCITPTVTNSVNTLVDVEAEVSGEDIPTGWEDAVEDALGTLFSEINVGGSISRSTIITTIQNKLKELGASDLSVDLINPAASVALASNAVPVLNSTTLTEV